MKKYQQHLQQHLAAYSRGRLGVLEDGIYDGREYPHVLPFRQRYLNFLEGVRAELKDYLDHDPSVRLHKYFHHLNSSQAFALNLFFPYLSGGATAARVLAESLGVPPSSGDWKFEGIPDASEGTNVDVMWRTSGHAWVFCEVKLSESGFGTAKDDKRHQDKLTAIYEPKLRDLVSRDLLVPKRFFENYQLLRNIALLADDPGHQLLLLMPKENESLKAPLEKVLLRVDPSVRGRIGVTYVEDCLSALSASQTLSPELRLHARHMQEKYVIS